MGNPAIIKGFKFKFSSLVLAFLLLDLVLFVVWMQGNRIEVSQLANNMSFDELKDYFTRLAEKKGAKYAFEVLKTAPIPPNTDMHLLGHVVGDVLYKTEGVNGIKICTEDFRNACSHSIVVGLFSQKGEEALPLITEACKQAPGGSGAYTMCFHGLGHGILAYTNYDMPKAIEICKKTGTKQYNNREYIECVGGTVMEIIGGGFHDKRQWEIQSKKYLTNDPLTPCSLDFMPEEARSQCYTYLTPRLFTESGADLGNPKPEHFKKAFSFCENISEEAEKYACYGGFGKEFITLAKDRDIRKISQMRDDELSKAYQWCLLSDDPKGAENCIQSALYSLYWGGENNPDVSIRFCSLLNQSHIPMCFENLIGAVSFYSSSVPKNDICQKMPSPFNQTCKARI